MFADLLGEVVTLLLVALLLRSMVPVVALLDEDEPLFIICPDLESYALPLLSITRVREFALRAADAEDDLPEVALLS